jgi:hypothetical protein
MRSMISLASCCDPVPVVKPLRDAIHLSIAGRKNIPVGVRRWKTTLKQFRELLTELANRQMQPARRLLRRDIERIDPVSDRRWPHSAHSVLIRPALTGHCCGPNCSSNMSLARA